MKKNRLIIQFAGMLLLVPAMISAQQQTEKTGRKVDLSFMKFRFGENGR